jgi:hypothetical protein
MIYRLPTRGRIDNPYRGIYPHRIAMFSGSKSVYHVELNNGTRYVFTADEIAKHEPRGYVGLEVRDVLYRLCFGVQPEEMTVAEYAGIMLMVRLVRGLRYNASYIDLVGNRMERR